MKQAYLQRLTRTGFQTEILNSKSKGWKYPRKTIAKISKTMAKKQKTYIHCRVVKVGRFLEGDDWW
jgi:hypothetical protein